MHTASVPDCLRDRPFTAKQAAAAGVSRRSLYGSQYRHVLRGVWAHIDLPDTRDHRLAAVRLVLPEQHFICGLTAGWIRGADAQDRRSGLVWIGCRTGVRVRTRPGCLVREITVDDSDLMEVDGVLMTTPLRTAFDCGRWLSVVEGTVVADALAHTGSFTKADLASYAKSHRGLRGIRTLDLVVDLMDAKSESPMETRVRVLLVQSGLPRPRSQLVILDQDGNFVARADLGYEQERVIVEYDGAIHWEQRGADDRRRQKMRELGWTVIVVSRDDYYEMPELLVAKIRKALNHAPSLTK